MMSVECLPKPATQKISVLLVDDNHQFRHGLETLLGFYHTTGSLSCCVVGHAASVEQGLQLVQEQQPQLVLLDMELTQNDGVTFLVQQRQLRQPSRVLVLSAHQEDEWVFRAMQAGACGYVFKDRLAHQLSQAIATVMQDQIYLSAEVATRFFRLFHFYSGRTMLAKATVHLTEREQEVLHWLVQGASNDAIAKRLHITVATVKAHLTGIFEKLEVSSRTQAIVKALKLGLVAA
ncbi:response regulator [Almyronema epifaneia]|uniref:Response regulator n=1 Tax=Almyronema epifaneia S1 TaxID=2991925 RepID=A0ABW6IEW4_9CYAN